MEPAKNLKLLKSLGFDESVLGDEEFSKFFEWFSTNITDENILTDNEIREFNEMQNNGTVVTGEELGNQLSDLNKEYPNILANKEENVKKLEKKLDHLATVEESFEDLLVEQNIAKNYNEKRILSQKDEITQTDPEEKANIQKCFETAKQLEDVQEENYKAIIELNQCYEQKTNEPPIFMYQMPLNEYFEKCDRFSKSIETYFQNNFKIKSPEADKERRDGLIQMTRDCEDIKEKLYQTELEILDKKVNNFGMKFMLEAIKNENWEITTLSALKERSRNYEEEANVINIQIETDTSIIQQYLRQLAEQDSIEIIYRNNCDKLERAKKRFDRLQIVGEIVSESLLNADILWLLMQLDIFKITERNYCKKLIQYQTQQCMKRMDLMNQLIKFPNQSSIDLLFLKEFSQLINSNEISDISTFYYECEKLLITINDHIQKIIQSSQIMVLNDRMNSVEGQLNELVMDGPVKKPHLIDFMILQKLLQTGYEKEIIEKQLKEIQNELKKYAAQNSDKMWRHRQMLWIYFLAEPKRILKAFKEIANDINASATQVFNIGAPGPSKILSGVKRKQ